MRIIVPDPLGTTRFAAYETEPGKMVVDTISTDGVYNDDSAPVQIDKRTAVAIGWQLLRWGFGQFLKKNPKAKRAIDEYGPPPDSGI